MSRGEAPERVGEALVFVGSGSLGRFVSGETTGKPAVSQREGRNGQPVLPITLLGEIAPGDEDSECAGAQRADSTT